MIIASFFEQISVKRNPDFFQNRSVRWLQSNHLLVKLLIIEEEKGHSRSLLHALRRDGYRCEVLPLAGNLISRIHPGGYDCILVNEMASDFQGIAIVKSLRETDYDGGIILHSVATSSEAVITGLNAGADVCLSGPIHRGELTAWIISLMRRRHFGGSALIIRNELSIDLPGKRAFVRQKPLDLTRKEFDLLLYLAFRPNKVISKESIATNLADDQEVHANLDFVYAHIKNLKRKLAAAGSADYITSIYGMGYKFMM